MKFWQAWRSADHSALPSARHLTFVRSRMGRSVTRTGVFLRRQLWVFPLAAIVVLSGIAFLLRGALERTMQQNVRSQLQTLLEVETSMLTTWFKTQETYAESHANDQRVREIIYQILDEADSDAPAESKSSLHARLKKELVPRMAAHDYHSYMVLDKSGRIVAADDESLIGKTDFSTFLDAHLKRVAEGETVIYPPYPSRVLMKDEFGKIRSGVPVMLVIAPVRDANFQSIAALAFRVRPERDFTRILQLGRIGETGETYAFDLEGRMISNSRFDDKLMLLGLMPDEPDSRSMLKIQLRDPGGNLAEGFRPKKRRGELPLTKPVTEVLAGRDGVDVSGYRNYRGADALGAWQLMPKYRIGVVTEIDRHEAYRPLYILRWAFWGLFSMLALAAVAIFIFSILMARMQREAQKAALESQKLGQYTLEEKLGSGGMGTVYKGRHAILRRPTAIKVLQLERVTPSSIERFEREVQITCQLNHPNTVQIYDYGHTPEGLFYYAMEYLDGIDLQKLVEQYGPQPEGRVIRILAQVCGSLYEAHSLGLVHRDIKPANIMLNHRGGEPDVAKVLDFGLVKALDDGKHQGLSSAGTLTGTPLYMSPEAIQTPQAVDPRSDIYAVGAVGYFLLTGHPVFDAPNLVELCQLHVSQPPTAPSQKLGRPVSAELEAALLSCLEKSRAKRPQTARDLATLLQRSPAAGAWSLEDADLWWSQHQRTRVTVAGKVEPSSTSPVDKTFVVDR
jgi:predicted Ser/Thr protein kinase